MLLFRNTKINRACGVYFLLYIGKSKSPETRYSNVFLCLHFTGWQCSQICFHHILPRRSAEEQSEEDLWGVSLSLWWHFFSDDPHDPVYRKMKMYCYCAVVFCAASQAFFICFNMLGSFYLGIYRFTPLIHHIYFKPIPAVLFT